MIVGLTGATGHLGGRLLELLLTDPEVEVVRSVARGALPERPKLVHTRCELTSADARDALTGVDVLYHLGAQLWRSRDGRQIEVNVDGTQNVLAGTPGHVVLASSAAVYGAYPDNPLPLREDHACRPNAECPYAWHKLEAERMCADAAPTTVLRISAVLGPHADPTVAKATRGYRTAIPAVRGTQLAMQFVDEADAAAAFVGAGRTRLTATFNVATADWLTAQDIARISGGRVVTLPASVAIRGSELAYRLRLLPFGADRSSLIQGPLALAIDAARSTLGWSPARTSAEVLADALR